MSSHLRSAVPGPGVIPTRVRWAAGSPEADDSFTLISMLDQFLNLLAHHQWLTSSPAILTVVGAAGIMVDVFDPGIVGGDRSNGTAGRRPTATSTMGSEA